IFASGPAYKWAGARRTGGGFGTSGFSTPNPMRGAVISYYLPNAIEQPNRGAGMARGGAAGTNAGGQSSTEQEQTQASEQNQSAEQNPGASEPNQAAASGGGRRSGFGAGGQPRGPVKITITDSNGQFVKTVYGPG